MPRVAVLAALATSTACSGDVCTQMQGLNDEVGEIAQRCVDAEFAEAGVPPPTVTGICDVDLNACEARIKSCTTQDLSVLQAELSCEDGQASQFDETCNEEALETTCPDAGSLSETCAIELAQVDVSCDGGL